MTVLSQQAENFYRQVLNLLKKYQIPFLIGGGIAVRFYTGIDRPIKDLDIFCKAGDYPKIVTFLKNAGIKTIIHDDRWLAQALEKKSQVDFLFSSPNYINTVDDSWFHKATAAVIFNFKLKVVAPEELIWCKSYVQNRTHYDGADINHLILAKGKELDWKKLLGRMENHWELLFGIVLNYRFIYPSERHIIPKWLMEELISRLQNQLKNPLPRVKICRGPFISDTEYQLDIERGFRLIT